MIVQAIARVIRTLWLHAEALAVAALSVLAVVPFLRLYGDHHLLTLAGAAALLAVALGLAFATWLPLPATIVIEVAAGLLLVGGTVFHSLSPSVVWSGITGSWSTLLTATLPAVSAGGFVALPVLLAFASAAVGVELAVRTTWKVGPVIPALCVLVVALLFTGKLRMASPWVPGLLIALSLIVVVVRVQRTAPQQTGPAVELSGGSGLFGRTYGLPTLAIIVVAAVGLGSIAPVTSKARRVDLRDRYTPPVNVSEDISPLAEVQSQLNSASAAPLFTVRFHNVPAGTKIDRVPVAVLDVYDGSVWGTDASFAKVGRQLPVGPSAIQTGPTVLQDYTMGAYPYSFLPALSRPVGADGKDLAFDRVSGMVALVAPPATGYRYSVTSEYPDLSKVATAPVKPGADPNFATLALPPPQGWPDQVTNFAGRYQGKSSYATLDALATELRSKDFGYNTEARPGHSLGLLQQFLAAPKDTGQLSTVRVGYSEQFAAAFAVLARVKGFPSRVVVGYRVDPAAVTSGQPIPVPPHQVHAWAEVNLNGVGWVPFDPTNTTPRDAILPTSAPPPPPPVGVLSPGSGQKSHVPARPVGRPHGVSRWWLLAIPVVVAVLAPVVVALAKRLRRHRRAVRGAPAERVVGAWREARERLRSYGAPVLHSMTVEEAVVHARDSFGDDAASRVAAFAPVVNTALYAPFDPSDEAVESAWEAEQNLRDFLDQNASVRQRIVVAVDPRPLVRAGGTH